MPDLPQTLHPGPDPDAALVVSVRAAGGTLLLVPARASRLLNEIAARYGAQSLRRLAASPMQVRTILRQHPDALMRLRQAMWRTHGGSTLARASEAQLIDLLADDAAHRPGGGFVILFLPPDHLRGEPNAAALAKVARAAPPPPGKPVAAMSPGELVFAMVQMLPADLGPAMGAKLAAALRGLATPEAEAAMVAALAFLAAAQAAGVGEAADAALLAWAWGQLGWSGLGAMWRMLGALFDAARAQDEPALAGAARRFAANLAALGVDALLAILAWVARKQASDAPPERVGPAEKPVPGGGRRAIAPPRAQPDAPAPGPAPPPLPATRPGVNLMDENDPFLLNASKAGFNRNGMFDVVAHGDPDAVYIGSTPQTLDAPALADRVRNAEGYAGQPVRLLSCSTGANPGGFAQQLADELGTPVTAPSSILWAYPDGTLAVSDAVPGMTPIVPQVPFNGGLQTFIPGK